jgi:hypothetical protein
MRKNAKMGSLLLLQIASVAANGGDRQSEWRIEMPENARH